MNPSSHISNLQQPSNLSANLPLILVCILIAVLTAAFGGILYFGIPVLEKLYLWFIPRHLTPISLSYVLLGFGALGIATLLSLSNSKIWVKLLAIFIAGIVIHYSFGLAKGNINFIKDRMVNTGHATYVKMAVSTPSIPEFLSNFESLAKRGALGDYAPTKPPGTSLIYLFSDRLLSTVEDDPKIRAARIINFSTYTWPAISYLPIFLIFLFGKGIIGRDNAILASLLYITLPAMNLINLHTDQTFYPLISLLCALTLFKAFALNKALLAFLSGVLFFFVSYLSFGMLPLGVVFFGALLLAYRPTISLKLIPLFAIGFILPWLILYITFDYNHYFRYVQALAKHHNTKGWEGTWQVFREANTTNVVEYCVWIGLPLATCFIYGLLTSWQFFNKHRLYFLLTLSLLASLALIIMFGKTKSETARLWMYLNPYVCLIAAVAIDSLTKRSNYVRKGFIIFIALSQYVVNVLILRYMDFI
jgi:hypothetical protein